VSVQKLKKSLVQKERFYTFAKPFEKRKTSVLWHFSKEEI
jgi:hypothetical protein